MVIDRRQVLAILAATAALPGAALAQPGAPAQRLRWDRFKAGPQYASFVAAIGRMRANSNAADPTSWRFWSNAHQSFCPHGKPYFLAWHRDYIALFERTLQQISGVADLRLPYWDYYADPRLPAEFTQGSFPGNPLFTGRTGLDVRSALSLTPFGAALVNFERGRPNAFEPSVESRPHNDVHNLIGGFMPTMQSPQDPIFWVHHANIDRLWSAWSAAGAGRAMPPQGDPYWSGTFSYAAGLTAPKDHGRDPATAFGYTYDDLAMPSALPSPSVPPRPPLKSLGPPAFQAPRPNFFAVGPSGTLVLDERSVSVRVPVATSVRQRLSPLLMGNTSAGGSAALSAAPAATGLAVVLGDVDLTDAGEAGGYFYKVYLNLPAAPAGVPEERHLIGTVGPFQINAARQHAEHEGGPATLVLRADDVLASLPPQDASQLTVSFVRINGDGAPAGPVIRVGSFRIEASAAPVQ